MRTPSVRFRKLLLPFMAIVTIATLIPLVGSTQGTSDDLREQCRNGGFWQLATSESPSREFRSQSQCIRYVNQGGTPVQHVDETVAASASLTKIWEFWQMCGMLADVAAPAGTATSYAWYVNSDGQGWWQLSQSSLPPWRIGRSDHVLLTTFIMHTYGVLVTREVKLVLFDASNTAIAESNVVACGPDIPVPEPTATMTPTTEPTATMTPTTEPTATMTPTTEPTNPSMDVTLYEGVEWGCQWSVELSHAEPDQEVLVSIYQVGIEDDPHYETTVIPDGRGHYLIERDAFTTNLSFDERYIFTATQGEIVIGQTTLYCGWDGSEWFEEGESDELQLARVASLEDATMVPTGISTREPAGESTAIPTATVTPTLEPTVYLATEPAGTGLQQLIPEPTVAPTPTMAPAS